MCEMVANVPIKVKKNNRDFTKFLTEKFRGKSVNILSEKSKNVMIKKSEFYNFSSEKFYVKVVNFCWKMSKTVKCIRRRGSYEPV